jgi:large subunit ribosomal protein L3
MIGLIGKKVGMMQVFDETGILTSVTVIQVEDNTVVSQRTEERDGYEAVVLGVGEMKPKRATKPYAGQFSEGITPKKMLMEFREFEKEFAIGDTFGVELFEGYGFVDVTADSKGKGYQGVMKRHGFSGGKKTHGSKFHRGLGSTGMAATPSKIHKGTKMPGRMGNKKTTVQNLKVVKIDSEKKVLLVSGSVPGERNGPVIVRSAKKKEL